MYAVFRIAGCATALLAASSAAYAQGAGPRGTPNDSFYGAGSTVEVAVPVGGDVVVAGRNVSIARHVSGDVLAAGWHVRMGAAADDDVRMAGAEVSVDAPVHGDVTVAGGHVTLGPAVVVSGRTWLAGGTVRVSGVFERDVQVAGDTVQIGGEIRQRLRVTAQRVEILPGARVLGPFEYRSPAEATVAGTATVAGPVTYQRIAASEARRARSLFSASTMLFVLHLLLTGLLIAYVVPRPAAAVVDTLRRAPGHSLAVGLALLVLTPLAAAVLIVSVLGFPIGLGLLALYAVALLFGLAATAMCLGEVEARLIGRPPSDRVGHAGVLLAGVMTLAVLRALPVIGAWVVALSVMAGLGALGAWGYARHGGKPPALPA
jgi:cytoskeletal protein CcmA (bactofilin family)